jgi:hypothetical protein
LGERVEDLRRGSVRRRGLAESFDVMTRVLKDTDIEEGADRGQDRMYKLQLWEGRERRLESSPPEPGLSFSNIIDGMKSDFGVDVFDEVLIEGMIDMSIDQRKEEGNGILPRAASIRGSFLLTSTVRTEHQRWTSSATIATGFYEGWVQAYPLLKSWFGDDDGNAGPIELRTSCSSNHLQNMMVRSAQA